MISFQHKFIFVHAGRTGGSSFERIAGAPLTDDVRTKGLGNTDFAEKHKDFEYYKKFYPEEFSSFFKFTIVRNPYDRIVSAWKWQTVVAKNCKLFTLKEFIEARPESSKYSVKFKLEGISVSESITQFDYIGRFEDLVNTYNYLGEKLNIGMDSILHTNMTGIREYQKYYDEDTILLVKNKFQLDLELFGYDFQSKNY